VALGTAARLAHVWAPHSPGGAAELSRTPLLEQPPVDPGFAERKFRSLRSSPVDMMINICLCRDWEAGVLQSVKPGSIVCWARPRAGGVPASSAAWQDASPSGGTR